MTNIPRSVSVENTNQKRKLTISMEEYYGKI